ncbi:GmrSD restriction endonuclease domain-containing protein [Flavobacteriaceae bacterium 14752]|uniref:GmrSD restriction endonuclease domain-containing protein n=1 Tax=Mesohalobacter salilacus TaxID=2491711 RepID=UPI000F642050|nr:DUF262 domain-containing protein [Flavobacteriaceae bacterium 14752]
MISNITNFWGLISENRIEIPIIQRGYAQGRDDDKVKALRENFVKDLVDAISPCSPKTIHLGFIYGKIQGKEKQKEKERNKRAIQNILNAVEGYAKHLELKIESKIDQNINSDQIYDNLPVFIPLDGQQRLTTLFLLHWYLCQFLDEEQRVHAVSVLKRFSYKTRKSSAYFCNELCNSKNSIKLSLDEKTPISTNFKNSKWFLKKWLLDSTVKGMLVMLDEIQLKLKDVDMLECWENLITENNIAFDFLDLNELNQTDELYVKMNARGVQLTEFEHFKAWLQKYVSEKNIRILDQNWKTKLDKDWLDLFWKNKGSNFSVDETIYNAFKQISILDYLSSNKNAKDQKLQNWVKDIRNKEYVSFKKFEDKNFFNENSLNFLFNSITKLSDSELMGKYDIWLADLTCEPFIDQNQKLKSFFVENTTEIDYPETVFFYSFLIFINSSKNITETRFKQWVRISRNLIFNTYIQNPENFINALNSTKNFFNKSKDENVYDYLMKEGVSISFFNQRMIKQEIQKIRLINDDEKWNDLIWNYENHTYFKGDIGFILEFCEDEAGKENLQRFKYYGDRLSIIFEDNIRSHSEKLLERSILNLGDYLPTSGSSHTFCLPNSKSLRAKRDNWQRFFRSEKNKFLKELLDKHLQDQRNLKQNLRDLIQNSKADDWRRYFIECPDAIKYCEKGFIRKNSEDDIKLLRTSRVYGKHAELRSYHFYKKYNLESKNIKPFGNCEYWSNRMSQYEFPCIYFSEWSYDKENFTLEITYYGGNYLMRFLKNDSSTINNIEINEFFNKDWVWIESKNTFQLEIDSQTKLKAKLDLLLNELNKINTKQL